MQSLRVFSLVLVTATALSGCGAAASKDSAADFKGSQAEVATAVDDFSAAAARRNTVKLCDELLASDLVRKLDSGDAGTCDTRLKDLIGPGDATQFTVKKVTIDGDKATAAVTLKVGNKDEPATLGLVREKQGWKLSDFGS